MQGVQDKQSQEEVLFESQMRFGYFDATSNKHFFGDKMKRLAVLMLTITAFTSFSLAQEDPIPPKRSKAAKLGGLFGYVPGWLFVDVKPINSFIVANKGTALKDNGVYLNGIGGSAFIMFIDNLRVGGMGMSGKTSSTNLDPSGVRRDVEMNVGFGGVTVEYVHSLAERLNLSVGTMLGTGGVDLTLRQTNGALLNWNGEWGNFGNGNYNQTGSQVINSTRKLTGSYFVYVPSVSLEYGILGWLGARLGISYVGMAFPSWDVDEQYELLGVPSNVSGRGFMINAGLFVGTF